AMAFVQGQLKAGVDLKLAEANEAEAVAALVGARNEVRYAFTALNNAMGATAATDYQLEPVPSPGPVDNQAVLPKTIEDATKRALDQRPELKSAQQQRQAAEQSIRGVRSELMPRLDAIASLGAVNPSGVIQNSKNYAVGLAVSIPLYTGGLVENRIAEERQRREVAAAQEREAAET